MINTLTVHNDPFTHADSTQMSEEEAAFRRNYPAFDTTSLLDDRVSLGLVSNFADVYRFVQFAETFLDTVPTESDLPTRMHC